MSPTGPDGAPGLTGHLHPTGVVLLVEDDQLVANALRLRRRR